MGRWVRNARTWRSEIVVSFGGPNLKQIAAGMIKTSEAPPETPVKGRSASSCKTAQVVAGGLLALMQIGDRDHLACIRQENARDDIASAYQYETTTRATVFRSSGLQHRLLFDLVTGRAYRSVAAS